MTLSDITLSLELAKELKELGMPQYSLFYHTNTYISIDKKIFYKTDGKSGDAIFQIVNDTVIRDEYSKYYSASTAEEILEYFEKTGHMVELVLINKEYYATLKKCNTLVLHRDCLGSVSEVHSEKAKRPVKALGKLLIWCVKNNYVTFPKHD